LDLLKNIQKQTGTSILLITHDMSVIAKMCDRVLVMYAGQIVESGSVDAIFSHAKHPYTQKLLSAIPRLDQPKEKPLVPILGTPPNLSHPLAGCGFCGRCERAMKICALQQPELYEVGTEHFSKCFKHDARVASGEKK